LEAQLVAAARAAAPEGAAAVIADVPRWPTQRQADRHELGLQSAAVAAVRRGDPAPIRREVRLNCRSL
jgi:hypothetical protein